jgi:putative holliday junction resolvase
VTELWSSEPGRVLAIDFGDRRVGIAMSDPTRTLATPLPTLTRRAGQRPPIQAIAELAQGHGVTQFVVGLPLGLDGVEGAWCLEVRSIASRLEERTGIPVAFVDERMTSVRAERELRSSGLSRSQRERKDLIDGRAAALILQLWLDRHKRTSEQAPEDMEGDGGMERASE